ncbi:hypothetical protein LUZ63_017861 [Rhynchospora breviuscula]|uniref:Uncharacterized protein n=1 Tax=Rhynchospora breviuscula TaxID=2022672 RepID=A0A9Q0HGH0_9POAL|nr:hypothetical protein LUZ63_017861 [Rhynchospora breviuscula]
MEKEMQDAVFWLPSEFLDDDFFAEEDKSRLSLTESDEDEDYMAVLTKQMTHSILLNDEKERTALKPDNPKVMAGSPQSTLCGHESPNGPSEVNSPPSSPPEQNKEDSRDLLFEAAAQVVRMKLSQAQNTYSPNLHSYGVSVPQRKPASQPVSAPIKNNSFAGLYPNQNTVLTQRQIQAAHFFNLRQQQIMKQQQQQKLMVASWGKPNRTSIGSGYGENGPPPAFRGNNTPLGLSPSAWPPLAKQNPNPQPGSGMRAVFLSESGTKRESAGTGVFLPRRVGTPAETPRKKPNFSTVLLPAKVVQTLNLNLDDLGVHPRVNGGVLLDHDALVNRTNMMASANGYQRRTGLDKSQPSVRPLGGHEVNLPQEWTY